MNLSIRSRSIVASTPSQEMSKIFARPSLEQKPRLLVEIAQGTHLPFLPLKRIVWIIRGDRKEGLSVGCIIALDRPQVHSSGNILLVSVTGWSISKSRRRSPLAPSHL